MHNWNGKVKHEINLSERTLLLKRFLFEKLCLILFYSRIWLVGGKRGFIERESLSISLVAGGRRQEEKARVSRLTSDWETLKTPKSVLFWYFLINWSLLITFILNNFTKINKTHRLPQLGFQNPIRENEDLDQFKRQVVSPRKVLPFRRWFSRSLIGLEQLQLRYKQISLIFLNTHLQIRCPCRFRSSLLFLFSGCSL